MLTNWLVVDVAAAPIEGAADYLEPVEAPRTYKDPEKIEAYIREKTAERVAGAALDLDLCRITAIGTMGPEDEAPVVSLLHTAHDETLALERLARRIAGRSLVTYNGHSYDLLVLMRRAIYLDVDFGEINLDRYRSQHVDVLQKLAGFDPTRRRSLSFYVRRFGWTDLVKPLSGEEESQVHQSGRWDELALSVGHDVKATARLAQRFGLIANMATINNTATVEVGL